MVWPVGLGTALTPRSSLNPADAVPARPSGGRVCGGLGGADAGHPLPGLLLHCPPLLHPGPGPEQGPAPVSRGLGPATPRPPASPSPALLCPGGPGPLPASRPESAAQCWSPPWWMSRSQEHPEGSGLSYQKEGAATGWDGKVGRGGFGRRSGAQWAMRRCLLDPTWSQILQRDGRGSRVRWGLGWQFGWAALG